MKNQALIGFLVTFAILGVAWSRAINDDDTKFKNIIDGRIIGGNVVDISVYPHQVSLRVKNILTPHNAYSHSCGGGIITDRIILTAAHCVIGKVASQFQVVAGTNYRRSSDGVILPVKKLIYHEKYTSKPVANDIAMLVLDQPMPINNFTIKSVQLAEDPLKKGASAIITGWGTTAFLGSSSHYLREVFVPVLSNEECIEDYGEGKITDDMFCAGKRGVGGKDACQGDSGGPVLINGKLAGIVSWGKGCGFSNYPGVYTNVPYLLPWVREKIAEIETSLLHEI